MNEVWIIAEQKEGELLNVSLELLSKGSEFAQKLQVELATVILGNRIQSLAEEIIHYGVDKVYAIDDPRLRICHSELYAYAISRIAEAEKPQIILVGSTRTGQEIASRIAAKLGTGLTSHCVDLYIDNTNMSKPLLVGVVPGWGSNLSVTITCPDKRPQMVTVSPGIMAKPCSDTNRKGIIISIPLELKIDTQAEILELVEEKSKNSDINNAETIIAVGAGLTSDSNLYLVNELAEALNGVVAGTRAAVDKGWISEDSMIGQSGRTVSPKLFVSIGASGAPQFVSGFAKSKVVLAIDKNPNAPIFKIADIGLVGDISEILPSLINGFKLLHTDSRCY